MIKIIKSGWPIKQMKAFVRIVKYEDVKSGIMKTTEKNYYEFKSQLPSQKNPFLNLTNKFKQVDGLNFIVEWQMGENDKKEVFGDQVYGITF